MATIHQYEKNGKKLYGFKGFLGVEKSTGKKRSISRNGFKTKKEAKLVFARIKLQFDKDNLAPVDRNDKITFGEVYNQWFPIYSSTVRISTSSRVEGMFKNHILPEFGSMFIKNITIDQIQAAVNQWFEIAPKRNYKKWYQLTSRIFQFAIKRRYIDAFNPASAVTLPKVKINPGVKKQNFWDKYQLRKFFQILEQDDSKFEQYVLFRLLAYSGIRRGECLALSWSDIDFDKQSVNINKTLTQGEKGKTIVEPPKTQAGYREIPLDSETLKILQNWKAILRKSLFMNGVPLDGNTTVFPGKYLKKYKSLNTPGKWLTEIISHSDLPKITVHGFRKSYCTALFAAGVPVKEAQRRMGHDDVRTTLDVYTYVTKETVNKSSQQFDKYMQN
ncbi:site-specific integrase [Fructilactobacillus myrtifloralis]|uniref:Site-specific integrase n=1 Tax=Fructilactobacillus myrtifloralis TaxID=2940301 RepID=A0ABY5BR48_9LACO|nr:site-specific integrase [Fructilactobacillus myrtifloralis]USS85046.1 site-specific integrase [Fructilactobacillus myrtifloralis]